MQQTSQQTSQGRANAPEYRPDLRQDCQHISPLPAPSSGVAVTLPAGLLARGSHASAPFPAPRGQWSRAKARRLQLRGQPRHWPGWRAAPCSLFIRVHAEPEAASRYAPPEIPASLLEQPGEGHLASPEDQSLEQGVVSCPGAADGRPWGRRVAGRVGQPHLCARCGNDRRLPHRPFKRPGQERDQKSQSSSSVATALPMT